MTQQETKPEHGDAMTTRRAILAAALAVSVALLALAIGWQPGGREHAGPTTGLKVVVVGIDGLDWFVSRGLLADGALPAMGSLARRGVTGEVAADLPALPEVGWTSLGRGRGLTDGELARVAGSDGRLYGLVPELAGLVDRAGAKSLTVGWPASWPANGQDGLVVAPYRPAAMVHDTGLPAAILRGDTGACPERLSERVDELIRRNEEVCEDEFRRLIFDGPADSGGWAEHLADARWAFLSDLTAVDIAASMMADEDPDLTLVCLGGLDAVSHRFLAPAMPSFFTDMPEEYREYEDVLENYYRFIDSSIERLRRLTDIDTILIVCSTYGIHPSLDVPGVTGSHASGPPGVLLIKGSGIATPPRALEVTTADLAPTVLAMLGIEIPTDMDGRVVQGTLPAGLLQAHPPSFSGSTDPEALNPSAAELTAADALVSERRGFIRSCTER